MLTMHRTGQFPAWRSAGSHAMDGANSKPGNRLLSSIAVLMVWKAYAS
ncbi:MULTISPECIES: hypothetical protein [unclassified Novosphingobium]|nr:MULTISPECIES: hypothetical protein [unclassified Novosphingobium]MDR6707429.1 hypothetical protein [Novosphingobium sp. 1748]